MSQGSTVKKRKEKKNKKRERTEIMQKYKMLIISQTGFGSKTETINKLFYQKNKSLREKKNMM